MKIKIISFCMFLSLITTTTKAQEWEFVGLDSMIIYALEVRGDTIWAGTRDLSINAKSGLYKSVNQGQSWVKIDSLFGNSSVGTFLIDKNNSSKIFILKKYYEAGYLYKTTNSGLSWDSIGTPFNTPIKDFIISPLYPDEYYVINQMRGHEGEVVQLFFKTTNGGNEWLYKCCPGQQEHGMVMNFAIDKINPNTIYVSGASAGEFFTRSINRGDTWDYLPGLELGRVFTDYFLQDRIYLVRYQELIYTNDGGLTWQNMEGEFSSSAIFFSFYQDERTSVLYTLSDEGLFYSENTNIFWRLIPGSENLPVIQPINYSSTIRNISTNNNFIYTGSASGIYRTDFITRVDDRTNDLIPAEFQLAQNYPNPFNPSTKISWQSPVSSWQTLKVYDVLGNEVATLVDEYREAGKYEIEFNVGQTISLSSGVYFYRLRAGNFTDRKKMILIR